MVEHDGTLFLEHNRRTLDFLTAFSVVLVCLELNGAADQATAPAAPLEVQAVPSA